MNPITFEPILKQIRWGGRRLGTMLGKQIGPEADYAESWEVCDHGDDQSRVSAGEYTDWTLNQLVRERTKELFGTDETTSQFPLLIKYLDCNDRLSVQVHPNNLQAAKYDPSENGKTEAWIVISAEPDSFIFAGLKKHVTPEILRTAISNNELEQCLHRITPQPGECYFIPAGTVHALGEGVLIAEVQQSSDLTFRLYDWGRADQLGNQRPLHIEQAFECIDFQTGPIEQSCPTLLHKTEFAELNLLIDSDFFRIEKLQVNHQFRLSSNGQCRIVMILSGTGTLSHTGSKETLSAGKTFLIPASCGDIEISCEDSSDCNCLIATVI